MLLLLNYPMEDLSAFEIKHLFSFLMGLTYFEPKKDIPALLLNWKIAQRRLSVPQLNGVNNIFDK